MKHEKLTAISATVLVGCYAAAGVMSAFPLTMGGALALFAGTTLGSALMIWSCIAERKEKTPDDREINQGPVKNCYNFILKEKE